MHAAATKECKTVSDIVMNWDLSLIADYTIEKNPNFESLDATIEEYRRFITLCLISGKQCVPSISIDEVWHNHILHSKDYVSFSRALGRDYIHHNPVLPSSDQAVGASAYKETRERYKAVYGVTPRVDVWGSDEHAGCNNPCNGDCYGHGGCGNDSE